MKHRKLEGCLNPYKHHLWRLPSIDEDRQPKTYPGKSKECIALYPLFQTHGDDASLEHHLIRAACWGRRSFLLFSDAVDLDIKIGFYVGDTVLETVTPILEENGIDVDDDIFIMDESKFEGDPVTHLGKKMSIFCDKQFLDYKWVVQFDCDMWLGSPKRKSFNFFQYIITHAKNGVLAITAYTDQNKKSHKFHIKDKCWWHNLLDTDNDKEKINEWLSRTRELSGDISEAYTGKNIKIPDCHGGTYAFPIQHYHKNYPELVDWIKRAGKLLQDDEAVFSLWNLKGEPLYSISDETGITFCGEMPQIKGLHENGDIYFSHIGGFVEEWYWREDADAL